MTRSDKRVTKCPFGHSELLIPTERAIKELEFKISFKTVHNAKMKLRPLKVRWYIVEWPFRKKNLMELKGFTLLQSK